MKQNSQRERKTRENCVLSGMEDKKSEQERRQQRVSGMGDERTEDLRQSILACGCYHLCQQLALRKCQR